MRVRGSVWRRTGSPSSSVPSLTESNIESLTFFPFFFDEAQVFTQDVLVEGTVGILGRGEAASGLRGTASGLGLLAVYAGSGSGLVGSAPV